jgi:hypothetical protein
VPPIVESDRGSRTHADGGIDPGLLLRSLLTAHRHRSEFRALLNVYGVHDVSVSPTTAPRILLHFLANPGQRDEERSIP